MKFTYPGGDQMEGTVIKATQVRVHLGNSADYATRVELIEPDGKRSKHIRFAYYRRPAGGGDRDWTFASQYTWVFSVEETMRAIQDAQELGILL